MESGEGDDGSLRVPEPVTGMRATLLLPRTLLLSISLLLLLPLAGPGCRREGQPPVVERREWLSSLPAAKARGLDAALARKLVKLSLHCVDREYPNKPSDVQASARDVLPPRELHPAFYGCFDWHSAVHGHWAMVRILKRFPKLDVAPMLRKKLSAHLIPARLQGELAYFKTKHRKLFERPYGWAWLLRLVAELHGWQDPDAQRWRSALRPLEALLVQRTTDYLASLSVPVRAGTHASTAFALVHLHDYATRVGNRAFQRSLETAAKRFYQRDRHCPVAYEPSGEDFISPCLAEAELMARVLPQSRFATWLDGFLPPPSSPRFANLRRPPQVRDRKDPRIGHLIGLSLQRAWALESIAHRLPPEDPRTKTFRQLATLHQADALRQMFDSGYGGAHWLASFALYLLTDVSRPSQ